MKIQEFKITILFALIANFGIAQNIIPQNAQYDHIGIRARFADNKMKLHWAPLSLAKWNNGKTFGYKITRWKVGVNNALSEETVLTAIPAVPAIKPVPIDNPEWLTKKPLDFYDIIWDALYEVNDSLSYTPKVLDSLTTVTNDTDMIRYSFAMYAAGIKYDVARMCGLTYEDNSPLTPNTKYRYKVEALTSTQTNNSKKNAKVGAAIEYGIDFVDVTTTLEQLPKIMANEIKVKFDKSVGKVELGWKYKFGTPSDATELSNYYGSFYVERQRIDSSSFAFKRQTLEPFTRFAENSDTLNADSLFYTNKVPNLAFAYKYRLIGLSYFDEEVISDTINISVPELVFSLPQINELKDLNTSTYQMIWQYFNPADNTPTSNPTAGVIKQTIYISKKYDQDFNILLDNISPNLSTADIPKNVIFDSIGADSSKVYYYKILTFTTSGDTLTSNAFQFKTSKKSKPATPTGLTATKKTIQDPINYYVDLTWNLLPNTSYQLFRRIGNDSEKIEISEGIKPVSADIDTLAQKMDYPQISYYLVAFDENYNPSDTLKITYTKPSTLRPLAPIINGYTVEDLNVNLNFELSSSSNVANYNLYRTTLNEPNFSESTPIYTFTAASGVKSYIDPNLSNGQTYIYYLIAFTANGLQSCYEKKMDSDSCLVPAQLVPIKVLSSKKPSIIAFKGDLNLDFPSVNLTWSKPMSSEVDRIELFKNETNREASSTNSYTFWKSLSADAITLTDFEVKFFATYQYGIRAVYKDGTMSPMSSLSVFLPNKEGCVSGNLVIINETVLPANTIKNDESCFEIKLKPGFQAKANTGVQYTGKIVGN